MRWKTARLPAVSAITGTAWIPVEPVPTCPTRLPEKSTPSCGQRPVWCHSPLKVSSPGMLGTLAELRQPTAVISHWQVKRSPASVVTVQRPEASSQAAAATFVSSWMSGRSASVSATWLR